jgi:hypothetical protein
MAYLQAIFPIPKMTTIEGNEVLYMRPGIQCGNNSNMINNKADAEQAITDNLIYAVNAMMECEDPCTDGIACMTNMCDWTVTGFATDTCFQFMSILQNKVPVRVNVFLIVNPPKSFGRIWNLTKPLLEKSFRDKVKIVQNTNDLSKYLNAGYQEFLPDDFQGVGFASTNDMVKDYVTYRLAVEHEMGHGLVEASSSTMSLSSAMAACSTSLSRMPRRNRAPWASSATNNSHTSDRSVCSTASHLHRRAQRRCSDFGPSGIPSSGGSVCSSETPQGSNAPFRPPRALRRASGSHFPVGEQKRRSSGSHFPAGAPSHIDQNGDGSSELTSCIRPSRLQRRASGSHCSTAQPTTKQSSCKSPTKFERRLSDLGAIRSNSARSINSFSSNKCVTFEGDDKNKAPPPKKSERLGRRLSGLGSMTPSSSSSSPSTGKDGRENMNAGDSSKPVLKRQHSWSTLATDAESTLTNISH